MGYIGYIGKYTRTGARLPPFLTLAQMGAGHCKDFTLSLCAGKKGNSSKGQGSSGHKEGKRSRQYAVRYLSTRPMCSLTEKRASPARRRAHRCQGTVTAAGILDQTDCGGQIEYCPVKLRRRLGADGSSSEFLEEGVVPYVSQFSRTENPLHNPGHIDIEQGLWRIVAE